MRYISASEKQTLGFAKKFARKLKGGEIIGLIGELGAGKTIFAKGLAAGSGIKKNITSPTFVLMKIYKIKKNKSEISNLVHVDAYRIKSFKKLLDIGIKEYLNKPDTIVIIEWVDKIKKTLTKKIKYVKIKYQNKNKRIIIY